LAGTRKSLISHEPRKLCHTSAGINPIEEELLLEPKALEDSEHLRYSIQVAIKERVKALLALCQNRKKIGDGTLN